LKQGLKKFKFNRIMVGGFFLAVMSLFVSACDNAPSMPPTPIGGTGKHGVGSPTNPSPSSGTNYIVGEVNYFIDSSAGTPVTSYGLVAGVAVNNNPVTNAAVTFTDPNGTTPYSLAYAGSSEVLSGVTCALYQDTLSSFTTVGVFDLNVVTTGGTSTASVTAINSIVSFPSPYTTLTWTGTAQENSLAIESASATIFSQTSATSPFNIPASDYMAGTTYSYGFVQLNESTTITGGTGVFGYVQMLNGIFTYP
jgi:hypothetical protein